MKNLIKKIVAIFLSALVTLQALPSDVFANEKINIQSGNILSKITKEIREFRTENSKSFELNDGQLLKAQYSVPVHKRGEDGLWQDIYGNQGESKLEFSNFADSQKIVSVSNRSFKVSWGYSQCQKAEKKGEEKSKIKYENIYDNVGLEYKISEKKLKENLVLNSKISKNEFEINYDIGNLDAIQENDKTVNLVNENEKTVFTISAPEMFDASGSKNDNLKIKIEDKQNNNLKIKLICDNSWLQSEERAYPVTIDPDYKDEYFEFNLSSFGSVCTNYRKKDTSTSVFLDLRGSDFKGVGVISVAVYGRNSSGQEGNCTMRATYYLLEAGKKYELYNSVCENEFDEVQIRFSGMPGQKICGKWSPDYKPDSECLRIGDAKGGTKGNTTNQPFNYTISPQGECWTTIRTKANSTSVYLNLEGSRSGAVDVRIFGVGGGSECENCTNSSSLVYHLETGKKYELYNKVRENGHFATQLQFSGKPGTKLIGSWSPDYSPESGCITVGKSGNDSVIGSSGRSDVPLNYIVFIQVPTISQKTDPAPYAKIMCESTSATMLLKHYGVNISLSDFIKKLPIKNVVPGVSGPDPNCAFALCAARDGYGCFSPVIANTMNKFLSGPFTAVAIEGKDLKNLVETYVKNNHPILIWATINMCPKEKGHHWKINYVDKDAKMRIGDSFVWPKHEHCLVLVGFSSDKYIVNDPNQNSTALVRCAYDKKAVEDRYNSLGKQAVVILKISIPRPVNFNSGLLNRTATVNYARKWWNGSNPEYPYFPRGDCANFASQCIHAGGIEMDDKWFCKRKSSEEIASMGIEAATIIIAPRKQWNYSSMWSYALDNYKYFKNSGIICEEVVLNGSEKISEVTKGKNPVRVGDIMYLQFDRDYPHHATIISKIENGRIYYAAHTAPYFDDKSLIDFFAEYPNGKAYILKIK